MVGSGSAGRVEDRSLELETVESVEEIIDLGVELVEEQAESSVDSGIVGHVHLDQLVVQGDQLGTDPLLDGVHLADVVDVEAPLKVLTGSVAVNVRGQTRNSVSDLLSVLVNPPLQ